MNPNQYRAWLANRLERDLGDTPATFTISYAPPTSADRALLEECERHLARLVDRYAQINAGDRMLLKRLRAHLNSG